jgi:hypothetical protein
MNWSSDLLETCPVLVPTSQLPFPLAGETIAANIQRFDVVVMTQSCDLANEKVTDVILCPHWDLSDAARIEGPLGRRDVQQAIVKGYRHRYTMLAGRDGPELPLGVRIVDLGRIFSLPKAFVRQVAAGPGKRLRLCPPYREYLSQAFARFFMRVGLPSGHEITLPK